MSSNPHNIIAAAYRPLWLTYGLVPVLAGLDKFFNILADWPAYVSPLASAVLPLSAQALMYAVGVIEIAVGIMVLTKWTRLGAWIAAAWLVLIAINLLSMGILDVAVRDLAMAVGAYTLARLSEVSQESLQASSAAAPTPS